MTTPQNPHQTPNSRPFARAAMALLLGAAGLAAAPAPAGAQTRFSFNANGDEVTDVQTGLVWQRCAVGMVWGGATCTGTAQVLTHEAALALAQTHPGWRLPNVKELSSLVDRTRSAPAVDAVAFPGTPASIFWSSSPYVGNSASAWYVNFYYGYVHYISRSYACQVRLVRASQ